MWWKDKWRGYKMGLRARVHDNGFCIENYIPLLLIGLLFKWQQHFKGLKTLLFSFTVLSLLKCHPHPLMLQPDSHLQIQNNNKTMADYQFHFLPETLQNLLTHLQQNVCPDKVIFFHACIWHHLRVCLYSQSCIKKTFIHTHVISLYVINLQCYITSYWSGYILQR